MHARRGSVSGAGHFAADNFDLTLRERNLDAHFLQRHPDHQIEIATNTVFAVVDAFHPEFDKNLDPGIGKAFNFRIGSFLDGILLATQDAWWDAQTSRIRSNIGSRSVL